jgi:hypothetical protein
MTTAKQSAVYEVQGSYEKPGERGRWNQRAIIVCATAQRAIDVWLSRLPEGNEAASVAQVIRRDHGCIVYIDTEET